MQLDASVMHGPTKRAGSVGVARGHRDAGGRRQGESWTTPITSCSSGPARRSSRSRWASRRRTCSPRRAAETGCAGRRGSIRTTTGSIRRRAAAARPACREKRYAALHISYDAHGVPYTYGTINMNAVTATGDIASVTTTSGLSWKIPGRVGDSPIIGAGQYCDNEVGAAGSTGRGEANIKVCGAFLAVEFMRQGMSPRAGAHEGDGARRSP